MKKTKVKLTWTHSQVGCYWYAGSFTIATRVLVENGKMVFTYPKSGYVLTQSFEELGIYKTLAKAQKAAEKYAS